MLRRALLVLFAVGTLSGFMSFPKLTYAVGLDKVDAPKAFELKGKKGRQSIVHYEDRLARFGFIFIPEEIGLSIENKSAASLKVIWDDAVIIDRLGKSQRVIHEGVRIVDAQAPMAPSVVARGSTYRDFVLPTSNLYWSSSEWARLPMLPVDLYEAKGSEDAEAEAKAMTGKKITLVLPIETKGARHEYTFRFTVFKASVTMPSPSPSAVEPTPTF